MRVVVLGLGFAASASAVVPTFDQLLHDTKTYLARAEPRAPGSEPHANTP